MNITNRVQAIAVGTMLLATPLVVNAQCLCVEQADRKIDISGLTTAVLVSNGNADDATGTCYVKAESAEGVTMLENFTYRLPASDQAPGNVMRSCQFDSPDMSEGAPHFSLDSNAHSVQCAVAVEQFARRLIQAGVVVTDGFDGPVLQVNDVSGVCVSAVAGE